MRSFASRWVHPRAPADVTQHVDRRPPPQLGRAGVLQHGALEVVAVVAERDPDHGVMLVVLC